MALKFTHDGNVPGATSSVDISNRSESHCVQCVDANADSTEIIIALQGSLDGVNFQDMANHTFDSDELAAGSATFYISNRLPNFVRAFLYSYDGTGGVTIYYQNKRFAL